MHNGWLPLIATTKDAQQVDEEIDEVKIERQCAQKRILLHHLSCIGSLNAHFFNLLRIVGCQSNEDEDTHVTDDDIQTRALHEDIHDGGNNQPHECHHKQFSPRRKVSFRRIAEDRQNTVYMVDMENSINMDENTTPLTTE